MVSGSVNICLIIIDNILVIISWFFQKLSSIFLKQFTESAETTKLDKKFHTSTTLLVKWYSHKSYFTLNLFSLKLWPLVEKARSCGFPRQPITWMHEHSAFYFPHFTGTHLDTGVTKNRPHDRTDVRIGLTECLAIRRPCGQFASEPHGKLLSGCDNTWN